MAQRTWLSRSFREKYQWPELGRERLESSPSIHNRAKPRSSRARTSRLRRETLYTSRRGARAEGTSKFSSMGRMVAQSSEKGRAEMRGGEVYRCTRKPYNGRPFMPQSLKDGHPPCCVLLLLCCFLSLCCWCWFFCWCCF